MSETNLGSVKIKCPACGGENLSKGDTPQTEDEGTCLACGHKFSLQAEVKKIGEAFQKAVADGIRKALKQ